jgi:hypothetical protein
MTPLQKRGAAPKWARSAASLLTVAALCGTFVAFATYAAFCVEGEGGSCGGQSGPEWEFVTQLALSCVGLAVAIGMLVAVARGALWLGATLLVIALFLYAGSFVLADAAIHGWDHSMTLY